jgi:hypothetical protein
MVVEERCSFDAWCDAAIDFFYKKKEKNAVMPLLNKIQNCDQDDEYCRRVV